MGEHFRKEVPASDNVSSSLLPFFCGVGEGGKRRNERWGLKIMLMGFLLFSRFKEEIAAQYI